MPNSRANGFGFIDSHIAFAYTRKLGIKTFKLPKPILAKGYNGVVGKSITYYLLLNLIINGRYLYNLLFLILDLRNYDIILRSK